MPIEVVEPDGHGIGRPRSGLTTKVQYAVDGNGRPLTVTGGQRNDGAMPHRALEESRVPRRGAGAARTRGDTVPSDKACATSVKRDYLRCRRIGAVIAEKTTEINSRKPRGSRGERPPAFDADAYKGRNVVQRVFNLMKYWRGLVSGYDQLAVTYRAGVMIAAILTRLRI